MLQGWRVPGGLEVFAARRPKGEVEVGQCYRNLDLPWMIWEVVGIYQDLDGIAHVAMRLATNHTEWRTLSADHLVNGGGHELVQAEVEQEFQPDEQ